MVLGGCLRTTFEYSLDIHDEATIVALSNGFLRDLRDIIDHRDDHGDDVSTPSDFPNASLDASELERVFAEVEESGERP